MFTEFRSFLVILFWFDNPWVDLVFTWPSTHLEICDCSGIFQDLHNPPLHSPPSQYTERWWHPKANVLVDFLSTNKTKTDLGCWTKLDQNDLERFVRFTLILVNHTHKNPPWIWYQRRPPHQLSEKLVGWVGSGPVIIQRVIQLLQICLILRVTIDNGQMCFKRSSQT